jgi:hypothetical protein
MITICGESIMESIILLTFYGWIPMAIPCMVENQELLNMELLSLLEIMKKLKQ